jgi:hypothetical protein
VPSVAFSKGAPLSVSALWEVLKTASSDDDLAFRQKERDIAQYNRRFDGTALDNFAVKFYDIIWASNLGELIFDATRHGTTSMK